MNVIRWNPFNELDGFFDRYSRDILSAREARSGSEPVWRPAASIVENENEYVISADLPAVAREDVNVSVENNVLTIKGERRYEKTAEEETEHRRETYLGVFERCFSLPEDVDTDAISAESRDGVLRVRIPKVKPTQPEVRQITIN